MRKLLIAALLLAATPALADGHPYRQPYPQHHPQYRHNHNMSPWVAGAIGLGVLGAGTYYYNQTQPRCWNEPIVDAYGRQLVDRYGNLLYQTTCN